MKEFMFGLWIVVSLSYILFGLTSCITPATGSDSWDKLYGQCVKYGPQKEKN